MATPAARAHIRMIIDNGETFAKDSLGLDDDGNFRLGLARLKNNDLGNAERFRRRNADNFLFIRSVGWHVWAGSHWDFERGEDEAHKAAHVTVEEMATDAAILKKAGAFQNEIPADADKRHTKAFAWAIASGQSQRVDALVRMARPYFSEAPTALDQSPFRFNVTNGTLTLQNPVEIGAHRPDELLTKCATVAWNPDAVCPTFDAFLERIQPDAEVRAFLQRWFGYCLTGSTAEQSLVLFHGTGANGKTTLVEAVSHVLGNYAAALPFASLLHDDYKRGSEASPDLARLPGARMVAASEPDTGSRLSESTVKILTGGEPITVRHLRQDFFEFHPQFKLVLSFNSRPRVRGQDDGIWRRLLMVPFDEKIPVAERDHGLLDKLRAEAAGILNWLVDGCEQWLEQGLNPPEIVRIATDEFRTDQDPVGRFLDEATNKNENDSVGATRLYNAYVYWCKQSAVDPVSQTLFGRIVTERGFTRERIGVMHYFGLSLKYEYEPPEQIEAEER